MSAIKTSDTVNGLLKVFAAGAILAAGTVAPNVLALLEPLIGKGGDANKETKRLLNHMKRLNLIDVEKLHDGNGYVSLTPKGKARLERASLADIQIAVPKQWDGLWHVVTFDIPKTKSHERYELLTQLRRLGFAKLLQSMWVYPFSCEKEIVEICSELNLEKHMVYMTVELGVGQHKTLIKVFSDQLKAVKLAVPKR